MTTVKTLMPFANSELRVVQASNTLQVAADVLIGVSNRMAVVCNDNELALGVVTRTDILSGLLSNAKSPQEPCSTVMQSDIIFCGVNDALDDVWSTMSERNLNSMPVLDAAGKPVGIISSKCVLVKMLSVARKEDQLMHDYIAGMGYH